MIIQIVKYGEKFTFYIFNINKISVCDRAMWLMWRRYKFMGYLSGTNRLENSEPSYEDIVSLISDKRYCLFWNCKWTILRYIWKQLHLWVSFRTKAWFINSQIYLVFSLTIIHSHCHIVAYAKYGCFVFCSYIWANPRKNSLRGGKKKLKRFTIICQKDQSI